MVNKSLYPLLYLSFSIFRFFTCHYGGKYCTFTPLHLFTFSIQSHAASEPKKHILKCIYFYKQSKEHNGKKKGKKYSDNQKIAEYNMVISTINNQTQILFLQLSLLWWCRSALLAGYRGRISNLWWAYVPRCVHCHSIKMHFDWQSTHCLLQGHICIKMNCG